MRQLTHPKIEDITVEGILYALGDPARARIFIALANSQSPQSCSNFVNLNDKQLPKSTLSHHFKVLRESGLITSTRKGVELQNTTRCSEFKDKYGAMISTIILAFLEQEQLKEP